MTLFQFKIQLRGVVMPPVWRQFIVPDDISFQTFHELIQVVFGWKNNSAYSFSQKGIDAGMQIKAFADLNQNEQFASLLRLNEVFSENQKLFLYTYDFTEKWEHVIHLEKIIETDSVEFRLLAGKGACPVEACDGIWGYERVKKFLRNPDSPEWHEVMFEMFGHLIDEGFNPDEFNSDAVAQKLKSYNPE